MGASTHRWLVDHEPDVWPYEQPTWVVTNHPETVTAPGVHTFAGAVTDLHPRLVDAASDRDVWVVGGGDLAAQLVAAGLVDEMVVHYAPCSLGAGRPVLPTGSRWRLVDAARNRDFVGARWARETD
jgi:dihydrofolate reductase